MQLREQLLNIIFDLQNKMQASAKPKFLSCYICGREFGTTSLVIHLKNCAAKFQNEQSKKQSKDKISLPCAPQQLAQILNGNLNELIVETYNQKAVKTHKYQVLPKYRFCDRTFNEQSLKAHENGCSKKGNRPVEDKKMDDQEVIKKPKTLTCCICGRDFGLTSLKIHYPQCYQKFVNDEKLKPESERKQPPQFTNQQLELIKSKVNWSLEEIEAFNNEASKNYRDKAMVSCENCGRRFIEQSYHKHKKNCALINGKKQNQQTKQASVQAQMRSTSSQFKKPRTLQCCVCGREFGLTSLKIHYPQCIQKFNNEEMKKPKAERKQTPSFSEEQLQMISNKQDWSLEEIQAFNNRANANYRDNAMVQCENCGRKFIESSYLKHKKNCQLINGVKSNASLGKQSSEDKFRPTSPEYKKPRTLTCCVCGRDFGLTSLKIHYPQCLQKFITDEKKKPKEQRKEPPKFAESQLEMINNKTDWTLQEIDSFNQNSNANYRNNSMVECENCGRKFIEQSYLKHKKNCALINGKKQGSEKNLKNASQGSTQLKKPKVLMCHICGRQFGLTSLSIHLPQCAQKFQNQEKKKQAFEKRPLPIFPAHQVNNFCLSQTTTWSEDKIEQYNKISQDVYRSESLSPCPICGRKFFQESLPKHLKHCEKNKQKKEDSLEKKSSLSNGIKKNKSLKNLSQSLGQQKEIQKLQEVIQQTSKQSTPKKDIENDSFLKKQLYRKIQTNINDGVQKIIEAEESLEQTLPDKIPTLVSDLEKQQPEQKEIQNQNEIQSQSQSLQKEELQQSQENILDVSKNDPIEIKEEESSDLQRQLTSPKLKTKSSKGFAAPRKKQEIIQANMKICKVCGRKFTEEKIEKHQKLCLDNRQRQRKSERNIAEKIQNLQQSVKVQTEKVKKQNDQQENNARSILSPEDKIRLKKGFAAPRQKESESLAQMAQCRGCKRKFASDRIEKHQSICKLAQEGLKQPFVAGSYKKIQQILEDEKTTIKRSPCPKCQRKFAQDRLQKHIQICKASGPEKSSQKAQKYSTISKKQVESIPKPELLQQAFQSINLESCKKCGRNFNSQRISKHEQICKGTNQKKTGPEPSTAFKKQKSIQQTENNPIDLKDLDIKVDQLDNRAQCSKCFRKFAPDRLQKHFNICKAIAPLPIAQPKSKIVGKPQLGPLKEKLGLTKSPKIQEKQQLDTIGNDQYIQNELEACIKCSRKFVKERLAKHLEVCKGDKKFKIDAERVSKNVTEMKRQIKIRDEQIRRTKNQFFHMMKDLKCKKIKDEQIQKELDEELLQFQGTQRASRKQNVNASNSDGKKKKETGVNKSVNLPKI